MSQADAERERVLKRIYHLIVDSHGGKVEVNAGEDAVEIRLDKKRIIFTTREKLGDAFIQWCEGERVVPF